jgi:DDE_Tnp_1-associated
MNLATLDFAEKSRLRALLDHFAVIEDPREPWRVAHPLVEILLLVVCGTIADCDDYKGMRARTVVAGQLQGSVPRGIRLSECEGAPAY